MRPPGRSRGFKSFLQMSGAPVLPVLRQVLVFSSTAYSPSVDDGFAYCLWTVYFHHLPRDLGICIPEQVEKLVLKNWHRTLDRFPSGGGGGGGGGGATCGYPARASLADVILLVGCPVLAQEEGNPARVFKQIFSSHQMALGFHGPKQGGFQAGLVLGQRC